jgi:hypothetical protein
MKRGFRATAQEPQSLVSIAIIGDASLQEHIDAIRSRRRKCPDHYDSDEAQNNHHCGDFNPVHVHGKRLLVWE